MKGILYVLFVGTLAGAFAALSTPSHAAKFVVLYNFQPNNSDVFASYGGLLNTDDVLYGTGVEGGNSNSGGVFSFVLKTGAERVLHSFAGVPDDGANPYAAPIEVRNKLYGTTEAGGAEGYGIVYSLNPYTRKYKVLHSFQDNGADGLNPSAGLTRVGGMLYGTTSYGGSYGFGTVFAINRKTGAVSVVHSFCGGGGDGCSPNGLIYKDSVLYGTTGGGGGYSRGTVFSLDPSTGAENVLYAFKGGADGAVPAGLIDVADTMYGTSYNGGGGSCGGSGCGTAFSFDPATGIENVLHVFQFNGTDGYWPEAALLNVRGTLYGTTFAGGTGNLGVVFAIDPLTGRETVLHSFTGTTDGSKPAAALIKVGRALYGTTSFGGTYNGGTIFKIKL